MNIITEWLLSHLKASKISDTYNKQHFICTKTRLSESIGFTYYDKYGIEPHAKRGKKKQ